MRVRKIYAAIGGVIIILALFAAGFFAYSTFFQSQKQDEAGGITPADNSQLIIGDIENPRTRKDIEAQILEGMRQEAIAEETAELVRQNSEDRNQIQISFCYPDPMLVRVRNGESLTFVNTDLDDHILRYASEEVVVPATESVTVAINLPEESEGVVGYKCDNSTEPVGVFDIRND